MLFRTLVGEWMMLNIMFTLLFGLMCIMVYEKIERKYISIPLVILIILLGEFLRVDYGWFGVTSIFVMYLLKDKKELFSLADCSLFTNISSTLLRNRLKNNKQVHYLIPEAVLEYIKKHELYH